MALGPIPCISASCCSDTSVNCSMAVMPATYNARSAGLAMPAGKFALIAEACSSVAIRSRGLKVMGQRVSRLFPFDLSFTFGCTTYLIATQISKPPSPVFESNCGPYFSSVGPSTASYSDIGKAPDQIADITDRMDAIWPAWLKTAYLCGGNSICTKPNDEHSRSFTITPVR